jgi:hypothetical protein
LTGEDFLLVGEDAIEKVVLDINACEWLGILSLDRE